MSVALKILPAVSIILTAVSPCQASDPARKPPPPSVRLKADWSGPYWGATAGVGFGAVKWHSPANGEAGSTKLGARPVAGGHVGYGRRIGRWVIGPEADLLFRDLTIRKDCSKRSCFSLNFVSTVRARLGWDFDDLFIYGTAGLGIAQTKSIINSSPPALTFDKHILQFGMVAGGGVEARLGPSAAIAVEGMYYAFPKQRFDAATPGGPTPMRIEMKAAVIQARMTCRF